MRATKITTGTVAALVAALLLTSCAGLREGGATGPGPDDPVTSTPNPGDTPTKPKPQFVQPRDGLVDVIPQQWDKAKIRDERTIDIWFYGGVEECYGLARVDVKYRTRSVVITLYGGRVSTAEVCIELAMLKAVHVDLSEPLAGRQIVDGASEDA